MNSKKIFIFMSLLMFLVTFNETINVQASTNTFRLYGLTDSSGSTLRTAYMSKVSSYVKSKYASISAVTISTSKSFNKTTLLDGMESARHFTIQTHSVNDGYYELKCWSSARGATYLYSSSITKGH